MGIWALLVAAVSGIFSNFFGIGANASMARYDKDEAPVYRQEYNNSYFEDGFQANDESATRQTIGQTEEPTARTIPGHIVRAAEDITLQDERTEHAAETSAFTVLSGEKD